MTRLACIQLPSIQTNAHVKENNNMITPLLILALAVAVAVAVSIIAFLRLRTKPARKGEPLLQVVQRLQAAKAQWPQIMAELNPKNDRKTQQLLIELRGPHMFVPHVALNLIENACRTLHASDLRTALKLACENMKKITHFGD